uniref:CRM1_C domain-containing protein n=1 Tax=Toxocara canis TaxID=6265 RepID=A0A183V631_TOXCA
LFQIQAGETNPFIDDILDGLSSIICDLSPPQVHVFYEAVGCLISAQNDPPIRESLIERLMQLPNSIWEEIILHASMAFDKVKYERIVCHFWITLFLIYTILFKDINVMKDQELVKNIANILRTNVAACRSIGSPFICQLSKIYLDMANVYKVTSGNISRAVVENGEEVLKQPLIKSMRAVKREILTLISTWVAKAEDTSVILESFVPPLFDAVLFDYQRNCPAAREPKVLSLLSIIVTQLHSSINCEVIRILDAVFTCTLEMINRDMEQYPEHRINFFKLLQALNHECFDVFVALPPELFRLIVDAVVWAFKHSMRNVVEIGFSCYADILCALFNTAEFAIGEPLNRPQSNVDYIYEQISETFAQAFPNLTQRLRANCNPEKRDLNLSDDYRMGEVTDSQEQIGEDTTDLFIEEREQEIQNAQNAKNEVGSLLKFSAMTMSELDGRGF